MDRQQTQRLNSDENKLYAVCEWKNKDSVIKRCFLLFYNKSIIMVIFMIKVFFKNNMLTPSSCESNVLDLKIICSW